MKSIYSELIDLRRAIPAVLATIVRVEGSAPQVTGASALFIPKGLVSGTLGGGLLEAWAARRSVSALRSGQSEMLTVDLRGEIGPGEAAVCGGKVTVLIDARPRDHLGAFLRMKSALLHGRPGALATLVRTGPDGRPSLTRRWVPGVWAGRPHLPTEFEPFAASVRRAVRGTTALAIKGTATLFAEAVEPRPRLIIAGAGHIGQALCRLGARLDFEVVVVDDRAEFANLRRLPEADLVKVGRMAPLVSRLGGGGGAPYIVIVTRGHQQDAQVLRACIRKPAAYIGLIGSRRKVRLLRREFLKKGWATPAEFRRVAAPVGLEIGAQTVEEIAVSIAAELIQRRRTGKGASSRREPWFGP